MNLQIGNSYHGFKLKEKRTLHEINAEALIFEHDVTKAKLIKLICDDDNKVFAIGFRTPPDNSTGVPHIIEHSVLCGSRKFDTKEPFVELVKSSLNTFLNAMTYPDKTIYPIASRNEKDFYNLMDVYLDAVFYPNIYKHEEIFMQEGWSYKLENKDDELKYNGVVYSEMKGVYSSPDSYLYRQIPKIALSNTQYSNNSGGDPDYITDLSYEEFIAFHKKYYHPSNSYIFLYGDGDTDKELSFINDNYLKDFTYQEIDSEIKDEKEYESTREAVIEYGIGKDEDDKEKTYLNMNFIVDKSSNNELYFAFEILSHMLLTSSGAPLKKELLDKKVAKSVTGEYDNGMNQTMFTIIAKNSEESKKEEFKNIIFAKLEELVENGIDKDVIEASVNKVEFALREAESYGYPKGLIYYSKIMDSYLYGGDPLCHLQYEDVFKKIRSEMFNGYFEGLIKKYILENKNISLIVMKPHKGLNEEKEAKLKEKLKDIKNKMSDEELEEVIAKGKKLLERQNTPDKKENLDKIPSLSLEDINKKAEIVPTELRRNNGTDIIYHGFNTNKIAYVSLNFKSKCIAAEDVSYIRLLSDIIGKLNTEKYDYVKLNNVVNINIGEVSFTPTAFNDYSGNDRGFNPYFSIKFKSLMNNTEKSLEIIEEIIMKTIYNDKERLKQIIGDLKSRLQSMIIQNGHMVTYRRMLSYLSDKGAYDEKLYGLSYYKFICSINDSIEKDDFSVADKLKETAEKIFNRENLIASFSGDEEDYNLVSKQIADFAGHLRNETVKSYSYDKKAGKLNEGILTQGEVNYVGKGGIFDRSRYTGALNVLETILSYDYLWNTVRVKGGAYGVFSLFRRDGSAAFLSYRDPNINKTINAYDGVPGYLENFDVDEKQMTKYVIGTISKLDQPLSNSSKADHGDACYFSKITGNMIQREREQVINTDVTTIRGFKNLIESILSEQCICALGNENKIKNDSIFDNFVSVK